MQSPEIFRAAQDARMYRITARELRREARNADYDSYPQRRADYLARAHRMERNARAAERAIVKAADAIIAANGCDVRPACPLYVGM